MMQASAPKNLRALVVMGVAGSGKSTVAAALAERLGWIYVDGDAFHPAANVAKMTEGIPLTDADREPWLRAIAAWIEARRETGEPGIVACSALRRRYREILVGPTLRDDMRIVYLKGDFDLIADRMAHRAGHFMPTSLLESQFRALEEPAPGENVLAVGIDHDPEAIVDDVLARLGTAA